MGARDLVDMPRYRRLFAARLISNIGNGVAPIALAFGVLALPGATPTSLSIVLAAQAIPLIVTLPIGGVVADRVGRARVIAVTDMTLFFIVAITGILFVTGTATVPLLALLGFLTGILNGLWYPAFPGLIPDVVPDEHLQPANAFISVAANGGLILGTAIGGALVALVGSGWAIMIDAFSFLIAGALVFTFRHASKRHDSGESAMRDLVDGWKVFISYRWVVAVVAAFSIGVMALRGAEEVMGPVLANEIYGGPAGWAAVLGAMAIGLLIGALIASKVRVARPIAVGMMLCFTLPVYLLTLALAAPLPVVMASAFAWGMAIEGFQVMWFTALQTNIPSEALGRVSAYDAMGSLMFGPIGLAVAGPLIGLIGLSEGFLLAAGLVTIALAGALLVPAVWQLRADTPPAAATAG